MRLGRNFLGPAALAAACLFLHPAEAAAKTVAVAAGADNLRQAVAAAAPGDVLKLAAGVHDGPLKIAKPLTLEGVPGAVIDGQGQGRILDVTAPGVTIRNLTLRNSGIDPTERDAAVYLEQTAAHAVVEDNRIEQSLVGIYVHGPADALVERNTIAGRTDLRTNERGNGIYLWNADRTKVLDNDISGGRDGIFTNVSRNAVFHGNKMHGVRFAIHYMYTNDSEISDNVSAGNHIGYAIMFSDNLKVTGNVSDGDRDHGMLFNYANKSEISGNAVMNGGEKCVFIYNANFNGFTRNWFQGCKIGIHFTAGSERNAMSGNAFIGNEVQVKYVGTRYLDWSNNGRGNYWSDDPAFDLNGDGIADQAYRPNDIVDQVVWRYPAAKLLLNSPGVQAVRWAQSQFPAIHPGGIIDSAPLMAPPDVPATRYKTRETDMSVSERTER
jgi:nitrous oxidase accessory protein